MESQHEHQQYQAKIDSMQKYVPFLYKFIEQLKGEPEKAKEVKQMQSLYDILKSTKPSVSFDDLKQCEEVLDSIYKINETSKVESKAVDKEDLTSCSQKNTDLESAERKPIKENIILTQHKENGTAIKLISENVENVEIQQENNIKEVEGNEDEEIISQEKKNENHTIRKNEEHGAENANIKILTGKEEIKQENYIKEVESKENEDQNAEEIATQKKKNENYEIKENEEQDTEKEVYNENQRKDELKETKNKVEEKELKDTMKEFNKNQDVDDTSEQFDDEEIEEEEEDEENVELIKFPDEEGDEEIILPDSANETENINESMDEDNEEEESEDRDNEEQGGEIYDNEESEKEDEFFDEYNKKQEQKKEGNEQEKYENKEEEKKDKGSTLLKEMDENTNKKTDHEPQHEEAEIIPLDEESDDAEKTEDGYDPLNCEETTGKTKEGATQDDIKKQAANHENSDDDVEIIETRISPICIDSDDDFEETDMSTSLLKPMPIKTPIIRPTKQAAAIRKSSIKYPSPLLKTPSMPQIQKKPKNFKYLQKTQTRPQRRPLVDTIDLLDSSDEEHIETKKIFKKLNESTPGTIEKSPAKRTLLPIRKKSNAASKLTLPIPTQFIRTPSSKPAPAAPHVYKPTPQSNFLNAINLQPAINNGPNPIAFSAQLSNKNVIIPNAFYGNPPESRTVQRGRHSLALKRTETSSSQTAEQRLDRSYRHWLEIFLTNFTNPQQIATHTCFVLLQHVLKYKIFHRIKDIRTNLNSLAHITKKQIDIQLMIDLRNVFYTGTNILSDVGRRFCEMACSQMFGKAVTLTADANSGRVTCRTRTPEEITKEHNSLVDRKPETATTSTATSFSGIFKCATTSTATSATANNGRKRQINIDDVEYTPNKSLSNIDDKSTDIERKKSLRTNRTRRYDNSFTYNEDQNDGLDDEDAEENYSLAAIRRKVERKRLEAKEQREKQAKSFENAFIEMFAKNLNDSRVGDRVTARKRTNLGNYKTSEKRVNSQANEPELILDDDSLEQDGEPKQHRIYKVIPVKINAVKYNATVGTDDETDDVVEPQPKSTNRQKSNHRARNRIDDDEPEIITCDDVESIGDTNDSNNDVIAVCSNNDYLDPATAPKNTDRTLHSLRKNAECCVLCKRRVLRFVHHYVNDHRGFEVYTSRLSDAQLQLLQRNKGILSQTSIYKNGQLQYEATCVFCEKFSRFMLPYWYQHFAMHTGEYAYRCSGCGVRKPTRSLLTAHINQPCQQGGTLQQNYTYSSKATQISACICLLCNYVQLHRINVVKHLRSQHNVKKIRQKHLKNIVLLQTDTSNAVMANPSNTTDNSSVYVINEIDDSSSPDVQTGDPSGSENMFFNYDDSFSSQAAGQWDEGDPTDDLSYMICGMLDVQMNPE